MICPKCGKEIPDGLLLCGECGAEIKIVPDFEPEIEKSISESLTGIADTIGTQEGPSKEESEEKKEPDEQDEILDEFFSDSHVLLGKKIPPGALLLIAVLIVALIAAAFFGGSALYRRNSYTYQIEQADRYASSGDYDNALASLARAKELSGVSIELTRKEASFYIAEGFPDKAEDLLKNALESGKATPQEVFFLYDDLIAIYEKAENYEAVNELLLKAGDDVKEAFPDLYSVAPVLDIPTGYYEERIELSMLGNGNGRIFYTLDGSDPSMDHGTLYTGPVILRTGEYEVRAIYYNAHNIASGITKCFYVIEGGKLLPPEVNPASGDYSGPFDITVETDEDISVYYTKDGSIPSPENGTLYSAPIRADMGLSNYTFIAYDEEGNASETVKRSYNLNLGNVIAIGDAQKALYQRFFDLGLAADISGHLVDLWDGKNAWWAFVYSGVVKKGDIYYEFTEFVVDGEGNILNASGRVYGVNAVTAEVFRKEGNAYTPY